MDDPETHITPQPRTALQDFASHPWTNRIVYGVKVVGYRIIRLSAELFAVSATLALVWMFFTASLLERQEADLDFLEPNFRLWFADAFDGRAAEIGNLDIVWLPAKSEIVLRAKDVVIKDDDDVVIERITKLDTAFETSSVLAGRPVPTRLLIEGGTVSWVEDETGKGVIGLGPVSKVGRIGPVLRYQADIDGPQGTPGWPEAVPDIPLREVSVKDATVFIRNARADLALDLNVERLQLLNAQNTIAFNVQALTVEGDAVLSADILADRKLENINSTIQLTRANLSELGPKLGRFAGMRSLNAPLDLDLKTDFGRTDGLRRARLDLAVAAGSLRIDRAQGVSLYPFSSADISADLAPGASRMDVTQIKIVSDKLDISGQGALTELGNLNDGDITSSPVFNLTFGDIRLDATPQLSQPLELSDVSLSGALDVDTRQLSLETLRLTRADTTFIASGEISVSDLNAFTDVQVDLKTEGVMTPQDLLAIWPTQFAGGARRWIDRAVLAGEIREIDARFNLGADFFADPYLTPERIAVQFRVNSGDVKYISTMPTLKGVNGLGKISGNSLSLDFSGGQIEALALSGGTVEIPQLLPKGGDLIIKGAGSGQAADMLRLINYPPFGFADKYGIKPESLEGSGNIDLSITRPLLENFDRNRIEYAVTGDFVDVVAPFKIGPHRITNGTVGMASDKTGMTVSGPVQIGPWAADIKWFEQFGENPPPTQYSASGFMDGKTLDEFGVPSREFFSGQALVNIDATGRGANISDAFVRTDLTDAEITIPKIWSKSLGEPATMTTRVLRKGDTGFSLNDLIIQGAGLSIEGSVGLETDYRLRELSLSKVQIEDLIDGKIQIKPDPGANRLSVFLQGESLDISALTNEALQTRQSGLDIPVIVTANLKALTMSDGYDLSDASALLVHTGEAISDIRLKGQRPSGEFSAEMVSSTEGPRDVTVIIPDASDAALAFLGLDNLEGGTVSLIATLPTAGQAGGFRGDATVKKFTLTKAPVMAQMLSIASLTGLFDTLGGEGLAFDALEVPFTIMGDRLTVRDARLFGPAIGMTGNGDVDLALRVLDFDGTLVPSYTANSFLGDIPIVGDILVGEKGGGVFALTYSVTGPYEETQINVNPLAALTPGFLRGIFKKKRDAMPEDIIAEIESVRPNGTAGEEEGED